MDEESSVYSYGRSSFCMHASDMALQFLRLQKRGVIASVASEILQYYAPEVGYYYYICVYLRLELFDCKEM